MKEIVIGKDIEDHLALLWCQHNAKRLTSRQFVDEIEKALGKDFLLKKWAWYVRTGKRMDEIERGQKELAELRKLEKEFIIPAKPSLKERILKEMVKRD
jgi:hypothetical protein